MALIHDTVIAANKAFNKIGALSRQAASYTSHPNMLRAKGIASSLARSTKLAATSSPALIGMGAGAAVGVGYDYATNRRSGAGSMLRSGLRGAVLGGAAGMGYYGFKSAGGYAGLKSGAMRAAGYGRGMMGRAGSRLRSEAADVMTWAQMGARDSARFGGAMGY